MSKYETQIKTKCIRGKLFALQLPDQQKNMFFMEPKFIACQNQQIWWKITNIHLLVKYLNAACRIGHP